MKRNMNKEIPRGIQSKLLRRLERRFGAGREKPVIHQSTLSRILRGSCAPTPAQATMLETVFLEIGYAISKIDLVFAYPYGKSILTLDRTKEYNEYDE